VTPGQYVLVRVTADGGATREFTARCRIDTPVEAEYYRHGGILQYVLRGMVYGREGPPAHPSERGGCAPRPARGC
jgi:aconitate hydratase